MLHNFTPRLYQETILASATEKNTLVVLPTGTGKTAIAAMLAVHRQKNIEKGKILFLAPTRPLVQQHYDTFKEFFPEQEKNFALFSGHIKAEKRQEQWKKAQIIFSTPQGLENDLISNKITLEEVSLLIFDEAHRATGDYAYVFIAKKYHEQARYERILALTASPGTDETSITELCEKLYIEGIEVRTPHSADMKQYMQELDITWQEVHLDHISQNIIKHLKISYERKIKNAIELGVIQGNTNQYSKTTLLKLQGTLMAQAGQGQKDFETLKTVSLIAEALKLQHAMELAETQSYSALATYLQSLVRQASSSKTKAVKNLVMDTDFKTAKILVERALDKEEEHPKIRALKNLITKKQVQGQEKIIIFTQFRDTAKSIKEHMENTTSEIFVGQTKKNGTGLSQKEQKASIERFRKREFKVLIATSVAEEGLDIPTVDSVIFFEPIPSAIRTVQRRGRTGRHAKGEVTVLVAKGTRDEGYRWSAHHKEKRMYRAITHIQRNFSGYTTPHKNTPQKTLGEYKEATTIHVDHREKGSAVMKNLLEQGAKLNLQQLKIGDYIIGEVVVEYKTVKDFVDSIIDGRLLTQLRQLSGTQKPIIILEGTQSLYGQRQIRAESIRGMIATISASYQIPLIRTINAKDTAGILLALAKKASKTESGHQYHQGKPTNEREQQEYVVAALPNIGPKLASPLLKHFGSVRGVMNASEEELCEVEKIGKKKARGIQEVLKKEYEK